MAAKTPDGPFTIRRAEQRDYASVVTLLQSLNLPTDGVQEHFANFLVLVLGKSIIATVGLEMYGHHALLRSLGVAEKHRGKGYGRQLVRAIVSKAGQYQIDTLVLLTNTAKDFFSKFGFETVPRDAIDGKIKSSVEFRSACPETAVCMRLTIE